MRRRRAERRGGRATIGLTASRAHPGPSESSRALTGPAPAGADRARASTWPLLRLRRRRIETRSGDLAIEREAAIQRDLADGTVDFHDLVLLRNWSSLTDRGGDAAAQRKVGERFFDEAARSWKDRTRGRVVVFPVGGVYLLPDGVFHYTIKASAIRFDWSEAERLLYRIDSVAEQAREWWPAAKGSNGSHSPGTGQLGPDPEAKRRIMKRVTRETAERQPHLDRAFALMTAVLAATDLENMIHDALSRPSLFRRLHGLVDAGFRSVDPEIPPGATTIRTPDPSARFHAKIDLMRSEAERAEFLLGVAAQRNAQARYARGMLFGTAVMAVVSGLVAGILALLSVPAEYAIAVPAGAVGALVSVLQRMTSGSMKLDFNAGKQMLVIFGALRPLIGGIFGMAVFVLLQGGLLPAFEVPDAALAFYAAIGFLAGFNERFAQDMLAGSAKRLSGDSTALESP